MTVPLVSILIPCFNAERWVAQTLDSALAQTWANKEIIVVDDGSSDRSLEIANRFGSQGVKVISQRNSGASAARNRAVSEAQGDFVQFLDADDLLSPDKIEFQMRRLEEEPPGSIATCAWTKFRDRLPECMIQPEPVWKDLLPVDWLVTSWRRGGMMPSHAWLTPREVIEKAGRWDEAPCPNDDGEFFTRVVLNSAGVAFCAEARAFYRSVPNSLSARKDREMLAALYRSMEASTSHLLAAENSERTRAACAALFQEYAYTAYPRATEYVRQAEERVVQYGGASLTPHLAGPAHRFLVRMVGWKLAARVREFYSDLRPEFSSS